MRDLKCIDSIFTIERVLEVIEGSKLVEINNIVIIDYRGYVLDMNIESYFEQYLRKWDYINRQYVLDLLRRSYREKFCIAKKEKLNIFRKENTTEEIKK